MRRLMPKRSNWRDTLRLRLIKLAARVIELKTQIKIHLPSSAPDQAIFATLLDRLDAPRSSASLQPPTPTRRRQPTLPPRHRYRLPGCHHRNQNASTSIYDLLGYCARA
jgi:hypothetical protein